jgi:hypothetical protein
VNVCFDGPLNKRSTNVNSVILIENEYVLHDCCEGDVLRERPRLLMKRWWREPGMVVLTSTEPVPYWI